MYISPTAKAQLQKQNKTSQEVLWSVGTRKNKSLIANLGLQCGPLLKLRSLPINVNSNCIHLRGLFEPNVEMPSSPQHNVSGLTGIYSYSQSCLSSFFAIIPMC